MLGKNTKKTRAKPKIRKGLIIHKKPINDSEHWSFSISKNATHVDDYASQVKPYSLEERIRQLNSELDQIIEQESVFLKPEASCSGQVNSPKKDFAEVKINISKRKRSPYVVSLKQALLPADNNKESPVSKTKNKPDTAGWHKEVERLRKDTANKYKSKIGAVDFLRRKKRMDWVSAARWPRNFVYGLARSLRWLFELVLSIPLGFLLLLQVLFKIIDAGHKLIVRFGRLAGKSTSLVVEEGILILAALARGILLIPIKLFTIAVLLVYRLLGIINVQILALFRIAIDFTQILLRTISRPSKKLLAATLTVLVVAAALASVVKFAGQSSSQIRSIQGRVLGASKDGFSLLASIGQDADGGGISENFQLAQQKFGQARESLSSLNLVLQGIIKLTPQGQNGLNILDVGDDLAIAGQYLTQGVNPFINQPEEGKVIEKIRRLFDSLNLALPYLVDSSEKLNSISVELIPLSYQSNFEIVRSALPKLTAAVSDFSGLSENLVDVLGGNGFRRYAVLFQNNNELRPAGGFIGSLALVDVKDGRITKIEVPEGGSYDFQGYLSEHVVSPKPLWLINPHWQLQDANWYPDWQTSAKKVAWFLEKAGYSSVDGVIALQATTLQKFLKIIGPINFEDEDVVLDANNVINEIQTAVEPGDDKPGHKPKRFISRLTPVVIDKILSAEPEQFISLLSLVKEEVAQKNILFYFTDAGINKKFIDHNWLPTIVNTDLDYLSVIHANIGGGKTDGVIQESWNQDINIESDGQVVSELTIKRHHNGNPDDAFTSYNNVDYARFYVPAGSELISASGFNAPPAEMFEQPADFYKPDQELAEIEGKVYIDEQTGMRINNEFGKTVFGNWIQVDPGNTAVVKIKYKLPFKISPFDLLNPDRKAGYSLIMQKQAGARAIPYSVALHYPADWNIYWHKVAGEGNISVSTGGITIFDGVLSKDTGFAVLFSKE